MQHMPLEPCNHAVLVTVLQGAAWPGEREPALGCRQQLPGKLLIDTEQPDEGGGILECIWGGVVKDQREDFREQIHVC